MVEKSDLQFFYTSVEPFVSQMNPSQSIGGYPSDSVYSQSGTLISPLGIYSTNIPTDTMLPGTNLLVDDEIIQTISETPHFRRVNAYEREIGVITRTIGQSRLER